VSRPVHLGGAVDLVLAFLAETFQLDEVRKALLLALQSIHSI
jgi:hypothetical protein